MSDILIKKSADDKPLYRIYRVTESKGRMTQYELVSETRLFEAVVRIINEW